MNYDEKVLLISNSNKISAHGFRIGEEIIKNFASRKVLNFILRKKNTKIFLWQTESLRDETLIKISLNLCSTPKLSKALEICYQRSFWFEFNFHFPCLVLINFKWACISNKIGSFHCQQFSVLIGLYPMIATFCY